MSVAAKVELYVSKRPYMKRALGQEIVNYSALARKICDETEIGSFDAVKAALSRYAEHVSFRMRNNREKVKRILNETFFSVRPDVSVVKRKVDGSIVSAYTANGYTCVVPKGELSIISMESPERLESIPGVIEFILSSLAAEGINVNQLISCREDTHLVIEGEDASKALELLQERL